jgi:hypothetical protein
MMAGDFKGIWPKAAKSSKSLAFIRVAKQSAMRLYQASQRATFGSFLEFPLFQRVGGNSRVVQRSFFMTIGIN